MRKKFLIIGMITAAACTAVYGCAEKKEGPQTIIIELADTALMKDIRKLRVFQTMLHSPTLRLGQMILLSVL